MESITLRNQATGGISRHFFGYTAGWFYVHFSGAEGYWDLIVNTLDGGRYSCSFYCPGALNGNPGWGGVCVR